MPSEREDGIEFQRRATAERDAVANVNRKLAKMIIATAPISIQVLAIAHRGG